MIRIANLLAEIFDTEKRIKWDAADIFDDGGDMFTGQFKAPNGKTYKIELEKLYMSQLSDEAYDFADSVLGNEMGSEFAEEGMNFEFSDESGSRSITGLAGSDAVKVFAIVINAVMRLAKKHNFKYIFFSAEEPSRRSLYSRIVPIIADKVGMYQANNGKFYILSKYPFKNPGIKKKQEEIQEGFRNWSFLIDKSGKIYNCGGSHDTWLDNNWKESMRPAFRMNVQTHGDDEKILYVQDGVLNRSNSGTLRKKLIAFAEDSGINRIVWTNEETGKGKTEYI